MKVENMPRDTQQELRDKICEDCRAGFWNIKGKCAQPMIKNEHPNPNLDNNCLKYS
jgi:hypothetical protein